MKRILIVCFLAAAFIGCQTSKDTGDSGIKLVTNGFETSAHYLSLGDGKVSTKEFTPETKLYYILEGVTGFIVKDGKAFPGASMTVSDKEKNEVLNIKDLFEEYVDGIDPAAIAKELELILTLGDAMKEGSEYDWHVRVWDKNGKAEMMADIPIKVVAPKDMIGIKTTMNGLSCPRIYILSNGPLLTNKVKEGQKLDFVFNGMEGYQVQDDSTATVGASVIVRNKAGENVMEYADIFKDYGPVSATDAKVIKADLTIGKPILPGQTYTWIVRIFDKSNNKSLESSVDIDVQL